MNRCRAILGSLVIGMGFLMASGPAPGWAEARVTLEPATVEVAPNRTFTVSIRVSGVTDLYGAEVHLSYDPAFLQASRPALGDLFGAPGRTFVNAVDVNVGRIDVAQGVLSQPANGGGLLATVSFRALQAGDTAIRVDFDGPANRETQLVTAGAVLPMNAAGTQVRISGAPLYTHSYPRGYNLIGLPLRFDDPTPASVLQELPGPLKLYRYQGGQYRQPSDADFEAFAPGRGYFLKLEADTLLQVRGYLADPAQAVTVPLAAGWNMIANPFEGPLPLSSLRVKAGGGSEVPLSDPANTITATYLWGYTPGGGYHLVHGSLPGLPRELAPWQGYWLLATGPAELILGPLGSGGRAETEPMPVPKDRTGTLVPLRVRAGEFSDVAFLGYSNDEALRRMQVVKPPGLSPAVRLSFAGGRAVAVRSPSEREATWEFSVETEEIGQKVVLSWPDLSAWPAHQSLILTDLESGRRQYLRTTSHYLYQATGPVRHFRLAVVPRERKGLIANLLASPGRGGAVSLMFTVTEAVEVEVEITGLHGQLIRTLPRQAANVGQNLVLWDGRDAQGRRVPNGTYLAHVFVLTEEGRQAMACRTVRIGP